MKIPYSSKPRCLLMSSLVFASSVSAATIYWDGTALSDPGANGLTNNYTENPNPNTGTFPDLGGVIGGSPYNYWNAQSDGLGSTVTMANGDDLVFGAAGSTFDGDVYIAGHMNGGLVANSMTFGPEGNFIFVKDAGLNGLYVGAGSTIDVAAGQTARFEVNSVISGNFGVKNGAGTVEFANGNFAHSNTLVVNDGVFLVEQGSVTDAGTGVISGAGSVAFRSTGGDFAGTAYDASRVWGVGGTTDDNNTFSGGFQLLNGVIDTRGASPAASTMGTGTLTIGGESGNAVVYMENTTISNVVETASTGTGAKIIQSAGASNVLDGGLILNDDLTVNGAQLTVNGITLSTSSGVIDGSANIALTGTATVDSGTVTLDNSVAANFTAGSTVTGKDGAGTLVYALDNFTRTNTLAINDGTFLVEQASVNSGAGGIISGAGKLAFRSAGGDFAGTAYDVSRVWGLDSDNTHTGGFELLNGVLDARGASPTSSAMGTGTLTIGGESGNAVVYVENTTISNVVETASTGTGAKIIQSAGGSNTLDGGLILNDDLTVNGAQLTVNGITLSTSSGVIDGTALIALTGTATVDSGTVTLDSSVAANFTAASTVTGKDGAGTLVYALDNFTRTNTLAINDGTFLVEQASVNSGAGGIISGAGKLAFRSAGGDFAGTAYDVSRVWGLDSDNTHTGGFELLNGVLDTRSSSPTSSAMGTGTLTIGGESGNAVVYMENNTISNVVETASTGTGAKIIQVAGASGTLDGGLILNDDLTVNGALLNINGLTLSASSGVIDGTSLIGLSGAVNVDSGTETLDNSVANFTAASTVTQKDGAGTLEYALGNFTLSNTLLINDGTFLVEQASVNSGAGGVVSGAGTLAFRSAGGDFTGTAYDVSRVWGIDSNNTQTGGFELLNGVLDARFSTPTSSAMGTGTLTIGGESGNAVVYTENTTISNVVETASTGSGAKIIQSNGGSNTLDGGLILNNDLTVNGSLLNINGITVDGSSGVIDGTSLIGLSGTANVVSGTATFDNSFANFTAASTVAQKDGAGTLVYGIGNFSNQALVVNDGTFILDQTHVGADFGLKSGAGKIAYRGSATPTFGQEWDLRVANTFAGGFDLLQGQIRVGTNSAGAFGAATSGPLGTGTFTIGGEGDAIVYTDPGRTLHNDIVVASGAGDKTLLNANAASTAWFGNMTLNDDLIVETVGTGTSTHNIYNATGTGGFVVGDGSDATTLRLRENGANNTYSGTTTVKTGSTMLVGEVNVASENSVLNLDGGTFQSGGNSSQIVRGFTGNGTITTDASLSFLGIRTQTGDDSAFSGTVSIANTSALVRIDGVNGAGGKQTFDSAFGTVGRIDVINGAQADFNSTVTASGTGFVVETDGTLGGTGTLTGNVLVSGNIAAGNSIGTLNVIGNVDFSHSTDGNLIAEISGDTNTADLLNITGDLTFGSGSVVVVENIAGTLVLNDTFDLVDWTGSIVGAELVTFDFTNAVLGSGLTWDTSDFGTDGTIMIIPEPSTYALLGGFLALAWVMIRRRQR